MSLITKLTATAASTALLLGALTTLPAYADGASSSSSGALTLDLRYGGQQRQVVVTGASTVAEAIAAASRFAELDPYRAATHNKGIMNGVDAALLATGALIATFRFHVGMVKVLAACALGGVLLSLP